MDLSFRNTRRRGLFGSFSWDGGRVQLLSQGPMLSPSDADLSVFWGKDEGDTGQSHPVSPCGSQGFPHLTSSSHWPYGVDFQEVGKQRGKGVVLVEPGLSSLYSLSLLSLNMCEIWV